MRKVSFKISKSGTRYRSKPKPNPSVFVDDEVDDTTASSVFKHHHHQPIPACVKRDIDFSKKRSVVHLTEDDDDEDTDDIPDAEVSFIVNIFPDGYTIDKSLKSNAAQQIASMYDPRLLRPYDRASQSLFAAFKCCRVPANFFEDIPCTYKNGKVACEVRDWRKDSSEQAGVSINGPSVAATPSIRRISLRMSVDSIVRDIPQMSKRDVWAYSELLEAEAKILLALYPKLDLDPYPNFDRLCKKPTTVNLNLDFRAMCQKRLRQMSVPEKSSLRTDGSKPMMDQPNVVNLAAQNVGQRTAMGPPNSVNLATQIVGDRNRSNPLASSSAPGTSSTHGMQKSVGASVPAIGPVDIIIIDDDEPVQRRSSSRPPKSGEFSSGATRRQYRAAARSSSQTERSVVNSVPAVGGSRSSSSNTSNSMHPTQTAATPGSKPLPTIPILSGIWPSSTIDNTSGLSIASASVQKELDRRTQDRFTKIGLLTARYKLNCKELKNIDDYKPNINISSSQLNHALIDSDDNETLIDETCKMPLSMSHAGVNVNLCKTRILKFVKEAHSYPAVNEEILVPRSETKLILSERQSDGTVTMHYCEFDDHDHLPEEELLPTFPNTHTANMFAVEFCSLMEREGYTIAGDYLQAKPASLVQLNDGQHNRAIGPAVIAVKPYPVGTSNASHSSSTHNMWMNPEGGGFSVPSPTSQCQ